MNGFIVLTGEYLVYVIGLIFVIFFFQKRQAGIILLTAASLINALLLAVVCGEMFKSVRPFVLEHTSPLIRHGADNGFPSNHALLAMTLASIVYIYHRPWGLALGAAGILVGIARVMAGVHHPIYIIGSVVIALGSVYAAKLSVVKQ
jgi:undecaprenyl-diphosphatase